MAFWMPSMCSEPVFSAVRFKKEVMSVMCVCGIDNATADSQPKMEKKIEKQCAFACLVAFVCVDIVLMCVYVLMCV